MSVVGYFLFVICVCVLATAVTVVVVHLYQRAETHPRTAMPAWVSTDGTTENARVNLSAPDCSARKWEKREYRQPKIKLTKRATLCYASAVYAVVVWPSVRRSVCLSVNRHGTKSANVWAYIFLIANFYFKYFEFTSAVVWQATPSERCCMKLSLLVHATANAGSRLVTDDITRESTGIV